MLVVVGGGFDKYYLNSDNEIAAVDATIGSCLATGDGGGDGGIDIDYDKGGDGGNDGVAVDSAFAVGRDGREWGWLRPHRWW